jgi:hypothetical protein
VQRATVPVLLPPTNAPKAAICTLPSPPPTAAICTLPRGGHLLPNPAKGEVSEYKSVACRFCPVLAARGHHGCCDLCWSAVGFVPNGRARLSVASSTTGTTAHLAAAPPSEGAIAGPLPDRAPADPDVLVCLSNVEVTTNGHARKFLCVLATTPECGSTATNS